MSIRQGPKSSAKGLAGSLLHAAGASVNEQAPDRHTALHWAVMSGQVEAVEILLQAGTSMTLRDDENKMPLQLAQQIVSVWTRKNRHPFVRELPNLEGYKRCVALLDRAQAGS